jgi:murein DD-endopeptidase MepM/ murein hydrolase activator NlpD
MAKKYTFMIFHSERVGNVRSVTISSNLIIAVIALLVFLIIGVGFSAFLLTKYSGQRSGLYTDASIPEDADIESQLALYNTQIQEIATKINTIDDLEYRIRDLVALQDGHTPLKPVAVGGKEVDLLRDYSSAAALSEKDFFDNLNTTLQQLSVEVAERELSLSELTATLEEKRLVMLYTPTMWPVRGWLSSNFGYRLSPFTGRQTFHEGMDIAARMNTDVKSTANGVVVFAGPKAGYGFLVTVDHGYGYMTRYGHNSTLAVKVGDKVERGQVIAKVGSTGQSTGPHVHYEVLVNGIPVNPIKFIIDDVL